MSQNSIIFEGRENLKSYLGAFILLGIFSLLLVTLPLTICLAIYIFVRAKTTIYKITTSRVDIERGFFSTNLDSIELWRINDIRYSRGLIQKLTNACTITLITQDKLNGVTFLNGFTASQGREIFEKLQTAISESRKSNKIVSLAQ